MTDIIDPIPPEQEPIPTEAQEQLSWLDRSLVSLTTWNWEKAAWATLLIVALDHSRRSA